jgi:hypothetical protein
MKIYVHNLPARYNLDIVKRHPSLKYDFWLVEHLIHRSILNSAARASDPAGADLFFVPFYSMCHFAAYAYDRGYDLAKPGRLQKFRADLSVRRAFADVMKIVSAEPHWKTSAGRDHIFVFGQGRGANQGNLWNKYGPLIGRSIFLGVEAKPFGNPAAFDPRKDIVIPGYTPWLELISEVNAQEVSKDIFIHFRGRCWGPVRRRLFATVRPQKDILITDDCSFSLGGEGRRADPRHAYEYYREMKRSLFCLCPAGWTPWSNRFYESILVGSIPVIIPGDFTPPFADLIDYRKFTVTISEDQIPELESTLRKIPEREVHSMLAELKKVRHHFVYHAEPQSDDAFDMILRTLAGKLPGSKERATHARERR